MHTVANTIWDCRQAKAEIALQAGGDLVDPATADLLESHLEACSQCQAYLVKLTASLEALQGCALESLPASHLHSLWPGIASRLPASMRPSAAARFNVWVPTAAMAVACAAMVFVTIVQLERVVPIEPTLTPQLRTVLRGEPDRNLFRQFPTQRLPMLVKEPTISGSVPVKFDSASPVREREW